MALVSFTWNPKPRELRWFGGLWLPLALMFVAYLLGFGLWLWVLGALGSLSFVMALVAPKALRPVFLGIALLTYPIGFVLSHVILATLFFLVFTPAAVVMRLVGRDALRLRRPESASTYWLPKEDRRPRERYFRQF